MDVRNALLGALALVLLAACSNTTNTVLSDSSSACTGGSAQKMDNRYIVHWGDGSFTVESSTNDETFKHDFIAPHLNDIVRVEHDWIVQTKSTTSAKVAGLSTPVDSWGQQMINAPALWSQGITGQGVVVAVVDSLIDTTHVQLAGQIAINTKEVPNNGIDDDNNGYIDDYAGMAFISNPAGGTTMSEHGTHVSGIIAADPSKGSIQGVAPGAKVLPASFITNDGSGSIGDAVLAMQFASVRGAQVINASWGGAPCVSALARTFSQLSAKGILLVVAAGNDGKDLDVTPDYPAAFMAQTQLTVAASDSSDFLTSWSNSGFTSVQLGAPGVGIYSTVPGNAVAALDGTSMSAPFVSGAAALLWSARPLATAAQIRVALMRGVDIVSQMKVSTGGRLDVQKAYQELLKLVP